MDRCRRGAGSSVAKTAHAAGAGCRRIGWGVVMIQDLTVGDSQKTLIRYTLPMFISVVFQQLYNIADSMIAGKFAGEDALAAVGASYPITMIFMAVAVGSNIGCSVVISQLFGAKEFSKLRTAVSTTLIAGLVLSVLLTVVGLFTTPAMMRLIQTPDNIFADGALYLRIYIGGFVFLFLYNITTGMFNSLGDTSVFPDRFFHGKYHTGSGVCLGLSMGRCRCGMGDLSSPGSCLRTVPSGIPQKNRRDSDRRENTCLFRGTA